MNPAGVSLIAIVGRPNVGKSSLFNRIIKKRKSIVEPSWGTTRDRVYSNFTRKNKSFEIVDTGGLILGAKERLDALVRAQAQRAIEEADAIILVCDAKDGPTPIDSRIAEILRSAGKETYLVANKADNEELASAATAEFYMLGLGKPYPVSALSGAGVEELLDELARKVQSNAAQPIEPAARLAIVGRPNVGKSSFLNALLEEERVIVDDAPGTTRDTIDTYFRKDGEGFVLVDTAGISKSGKVNSAADAYSVSRARQAIERCDCCLLLIDAVDGLVTQDAGILASIKAAGKGVVLVANKWDLVKGVTMESYAGSMRWRLVFAPNLPMAFVSSKTKRNVTKVIDIAKKVVENSSRRVGTHTLCDALKRFERSHPHPIVHGKRVRFYYMTQVSIRPPRFLIFANYPSSVMESYTKFLENKIQQLDDFSGVPIFIEYRSRSEKG